MGIDIVSYLMGKAAGGGGGGGGVTILSGNTEPSAGQGSNGAIYLKYHASILPSGYTDAEYIVFAGAQYFDTGISANTADLRVVATLMPTATSEQAFYGGAWSENGFFLMAYGGKYRWHSGGKAVDGPSIVVGEWVEIESNKSELIVDGTTYALTSPSGTDQSYNLTIGSVTSDLRGNMAHMQSKEFKLYSGTTLLADFVPAVDSSNVPCFLDVVRDATYYSAGSAFAAGPTLPDGAVEAAYAKVNGVWQPLVGTDINDINLG